MNLVLCNNDTYDEVYEAEAYKYIRIVSELDPVGYAGIRVLVHDEDCLNDDSMFRLQEDMELLHDYGYLKVVYVDGAGIHSNRTYTKPDVTHNPQVEMPV